MMHLYVKRMLVAVLFVIAKKIKKVTTTTNPKNSNTEREEKKKYPPKTDNKLCYVCTKELYIAMKINKLQWQAVTSMTPAM